MKRRDTLALAAATLGLPGAATAVVGPDGQKVLRTAFRVAETGFDPAQISDLYSRTVTPHIFEGMYHYDPLARPAKIRPLTAEALPEVSADFKSWTVRLKRGIFFADDPAFKGQPRELVAADYAYSVKRFADPAVKAPAWGFIEDLEIIGLAALRKESLATKRPFDYERPIEGLEVLDRYTLRIRLAKSQPRFITSISSSDLMGAVAREVVEHYGDKIMGHPVGTGPFRLAQWRRSSMIVLERNPAYREVRFNAEPAADDAEGQAILRRLQGRRLPMVDRVEVSIIEENQPRWLSFLQGSLDVIEEVPPEFINVAYPGGKVAPHLARKGVRGTRMVRSDIALIVFNMDDPMVGGYDAAQTALRRAIALATDIPTEIARARRGQAIPAQTPINPNTNNYDPALRSENGSYDLPRAKALLDLYGYVDRDGDGWRERPDGTPLVLKMNTQPDQQSRELDELQRRDMTALGVRIEFQPAKWPENLKAARSGKYMMWRVGSLSADPDGQSGLMRYLSGHFGGQNLARFRNPRMDALYEELSTLPDGPGRRALFNEATRLALAYMPYKAQVHRMVTDLMQPWVVGYRRPLFWNEWWMYVDLEPAKGSPA